MCQLPNVALSVSVSHVFLHLGLILILMIKLDQLKS